MGNHSYSLIDPSTSYSQFPNSSQRPVLSDTRKQPMSLYASSVALAAFLASLLVLVFLHQSGNLEKVPAEISSKYVLRGRALGVSDKSSFGPPLGLNKVYSYNWSNAMLSWQRTAYHFQPEKNWMNDPDGPLFHKGWYHLFYQYNPDSAIWGNITWGHAVSKDLIHWLYLPFAMIPDSWFDSNGVWTGSATLLPDGQIIMLYTGDTDNYVQVQNLAYPANLSDPLLLDWIKYPNNPVMVPPHGIAPKDFRDPTTAWQGPNGTWRVMVGSKRKKTGIALVYQTSNFTSYELLDGLLHAVDGTGMWECVDFYPVSTTGVNGLDTSAEGPGIKHVLKSSLDDNKHDYYALGTYDHLKNTWTPDYPELDVGIGLRVDYGKYYASKTFYDQSTERRILWGWVGETDSEVADIKKGWASVQTIPREVTFDQKTGTNLMQWPVAELESLRTTSSEFPNAEVGPGSVVPVDIGSATQLDISAEFEIDEESLEAVREENVDADYVCGDNLGAASTRGKLGPFGILTIADEALTEFTPIYFYITRSNGSFRTWFCTDQTRSSTANDVGRLVYGSEIPVLTGEKFSARILVDHSVVESFGQGGRTVITARVYPTKAIYGAAKLFLFNNATDVSVKATLKIWQLSNAFIRPFPFDEIDSV